MFVTSGKIKGSSIWEVRGEVQRFVYRALMLWVAVDNGLRLAEKRAFHAPNRNRWMKVRDTIMQDVVKNGWNKELKRGI